MERDPDYIDPSVLKRRAASGGGAGAKSGRPKVHRVADEPDSGVRIGRSMTGIAVSDSHTSGLRVRGDVHRSTVTR